MVARLRNSFLRLKRKIRRDGIVASICSIASGKFNRIFRARLCVWVWNAGEGLADAPVDVEVIRYSSVDAVPQRIIDELIAGDTATFVPRMQEEFNGGGVLWVGLIDGKVAGYQWSRTGDHVQNWHFDLSDRDVLIYSTVTFHEFRGRRVARAVMAAICRQEVSAGGRACADCMVWNTPAVRFIEKTGFTKVAERKPLPDHPD